MDWKACPKVELHLHLDCSLSYQVVQAINPAITYRVYQQTFFAPAKCTDLMDCLTRAQQAIALMQTKEHLRLVVADLFEQFQQDHVLYAEIRFAPLLHTEQGLSAEEVVDTINTATVQASAATGIEARLILCTLRHYSAEQSIQTAKLVERFRGSAVVAFDIAGDEAGCPLEPHIPAFEYAAQRGISITAHAGEASGPASVWQTLQRLHPSRLGHGVRSIEDPALIDALREQRIHLEVCPTSNVQTKTCATYADHPIARLYDLGLSVGVNTDMRTISTITLSQEYEHLHKVFSWDKEHFLQCNLHAIQAAFLSDEDKQRLEERVRAAFLTLG